MSTDLHWLREGERLEDGLLFMERHGIGAMPVRCADGRPAGLLMQRDCIDLGEDTDSLTVGEACRAWVAVDQDALLEEALRTLDAERIGRIPVVSDGEVVGGISRYAIRAYRELERELGLNMADLVREVSPRDTMFDGRLWVYLTSGPSALRCIRRGLSAAGAKPPASILDFGCGHGRTLRFLKIAYPEASLTASDIEEDGVDFCRRVFGVRAVVSHEDPRRIELSGEFDLIWCASVVTHVDRDRWPRFLKLFESHLSPRGILIFTTGGIPVVEALRRGDFDYSLPPEALTRLLGRFDQEGFGYVDYPGWPNYGVAVSTAEWVRNQVETETGLRVVDYNERGLDDHQDVVTCVGQVRVA